MVHLTQLKKQMLCLLFSCLFFVEIMVVPAMAEEAVRDDLSWMQSESAVLMEAETGQIILQKDAQKSMSPASITKIMTLLLIFEEIESGKLKLSDPVTTSAYAKSMGGSQVFLEEGEVQSVETMIKCIAVASGNDASVAMAEKIAGSEEAFVERMNQKAAELGMKNTHFLDCSGLSDSDDHYTSALDVAIMSRALIVKYPEIFQYTKIWMEDIVHSTRQGESTFTLSSTNKLLREYEYATGLKTGSTSKAKYCFSATAEKNGISMIAVVMAAPDYKVRFSETKQLLEYGFEMSHKYKDETLEPLPDIKINGGMKESAGVGRKEPFVYLDTKGRDLSKIEKQIQYREQMDAPVQEGDVVGEISYFLDGEKIGTSDIICFQTVMKARYKDCLEKVWEKMLL